MKKYNRLSQLNKRVKDLTKKRDAINQYYEDGRVCVQCCMDYDKINTDIILTNKKITFLKQGKSFLGDCFGVDTAEVRSKL